MAKSDDHLGPALSQLELLEAQYGPTYGEFCDIFGITEPAILARADKLDGYTTTTRKGK